MKCNSYIRTLCFMVLLSGTAAHAEWGDTYQATCRNIEQRGPILSAYCMNMYQRFQMSEVDLRTCGRGGVSNRNGTLSCNIPLAFDRMRPRPSEQNSFLPEDRFDRRHGDYNNRHRDRDRDYYNRRDWEDRGDDRHWR